MALSGTSKSPWRAAGVCTPERPQPGPPRLFLQLEAPVREQGRHEGETRERLDPKVSDVNQEGGAEAFSPRGEKQEARGWG